MCIRDRFMVFSPIFLACHPGRSVAESRDPGATALPLAPGSRVGFAARDDTKKELLDQLDRHGGGFAAADAQAGQTLLAAARLQGVDQGAEDARA